MVQCCKCRKEFSFWNAYSKDGKDYCPDCWKDKDIMDKAKQKAEETKQAILNDKEDTKRDKELVRKIYEKREKGENLTFGEKCRVVNKSSDIGLIFRVVFYLFWAVRVAEFEARYSDIKNDYGIGKEYQKRIKR
jgi:hypothetical protein